MNVRISCIRDFFVIVGIVSSLGACGQPNRAPAPAGEGPGVGPGGPSAPDAGVQPPGCPPLPVDAPRWPSSVPMEEVALPGELEFGQTHVVRAHEDRIAPRLISGRAAIVLFTAARPMDPAIPLRLAAFRDAQPLGAVSMRPPGRLPAALEQSLTQTPLPPYAPEVWSAEIPGTWMHEGVTLLLGFEGAQRHLMRHVLSDLAPPSHITMRRGSMVLFGDDTFLPPPVDMEKLAHDYYPVAPFTTMRFIEYTPFRLESVLVGNPSGAVERVFTDQALRAARPAPDTVYYPFLKQFFAFRLTLANSGHGLVSTAGEPLSSDPYAIGTSFVQGGYRRADGSRGDVYDHPSGGAGWLGWTCLHHGSGCNNVTTHEWGHSFTLLHFVGGTAAAWGIADQYPQDGVNLASHPWGFDTWRGRFRTWYRVDSPRTDLDNLVGKHDPMNGGEARNAETCFPQYTAYHALRIQRWHEERLVIGDFDGPPGIYAWDSTGHRYRRSSPQNGGQEPLRLRTPAMTVIGAVSRDLADIYAPIFTREAVLFRLPDPLDPGLPQEFQGARHFLEVETTAGSSFAMVAVGDLSPGEIRYFSVNLPADGSVVRVRLHRSSTGYPGVTLPNSTVVASRAMPAPPELPPVYRVGTSPRSTSTLPLTRACRDDADCGVDALRAVLHKGPGQLTFTRVGDQPLSGLGCDQAGGWSEFSVPVVNEEGTPANLVVRGQRMIDVEGQPLRFALNDQGNLRVGAHVRHSVEVWIPHQSTTALAPGRYRTAGVVPMNGALLSLDGSRPPVTVNISVDLDVLASVEADVSPGLTWTSEPARATQASYYFLTDRSYGPSTRVWWDAPEPSEIRAPVIDAATGASAILTLHAMTRACGVDRAMQAGRGVGDCEHQLVLQVPPGENTGLQPGTTYVSPSAEPVPFFMHEWHAPAGETRRAAFAVSLRYTHR